MRRRRYWTVSPPGFEPGTKGLKVPCSTVELRALGAGGGSSLTPAGDDGPVSGAIRALSLSGIFSSSALGQGRADVGGPSLASTSLRRATAIAAEMEPVSAAAQITCG